ncbi:hypothetical protein PG996_013100 [Apiospora saccharicola]|uniref:non-specific serine/threonine protein kinase n=1 Tax=Apiospora saccharicola TaxID=335842 RepID=A0ABR1U4I0_9PEZI
MANIQLSNLNLGDPTVTVLAVGPIDLARWFKVIVNERHIVYVEVDDGALPRGWQDMGAAGNPMVTLPPFPPQYVGQSNYMGLSLAHTATGRRTVWVLKQPFQFFKNHIEVWHNLSFDYASIRRIRRIDNGYQGRLHDRSWLVQIPDVGQIYSSKLQQEVTLHQQAAAGAPGVVPAFLALVTEPWRGVVGFLMEYIEDAVTLNKVPDKRVYNRMVRNAVERLHNEALIAHQDLHDENILVKRDGSRLVLIDFEQALDLRRPGLDFETSVRSDNMAWQMFSKR